MVGYLRGPRVDAVAYNLAHDLATPLAVIGAVFVAHSGMDRPAGYGPKLPSSFKDTHLGRDGAEQLLTRIHRARRFGSLV